jgi:hypothetical protein
VWELWERNPNELAIAINTTLCDKVCQSPATGQWFSPGPLVSSTNKTDRHDIIEMLLKLALNTISPFSNRKCLPVLGLFVDDCDRGGCKTSV